MEQITVSIDEGARRLLEISGFILRDKGQPNSLSDSIRELAKNPIDICDSCHSDYGGCGGTQSVGTDERVYDCPAYAHLIKLEDYIVKE